MDPLSLRLHLHLPPLHPEHARHQPMMEITDL
jgi:hypothetical protein